METSDIRKSAFSLGKISHALKSPLLKAKAPFGAVNVLQGSRTNQHKLPQHNTNHFDLKLLPERLVAIGVTFVQCPVWGSYLSTEFSMFSPS